MTTVGTKILVTEINQVTVINQDVQEVVSLNDAILAFSVVVVKQSRALLSRVPGKVCRVAQESRRDPRRLCSRPENLPCQNPSRIFSH